MFLRGLFVLLILACPVQAAEFLALGYLEQESSLGSTYAERISDDGSAVIGSGYIGGPLVFRWTESSGLQQISTMLGAGIYGGVSNEGNIVVGNFFDMMSSFPTPYLWNVGTGIEPLSQVIDSRFANLATDITSDGKFVVGLAGGGISGPFSEAFRLDLAGNLIGLGHLPGGNEFSMAAAVSADGSAITGHTFFNAVYESHAFLWTEENGMIDLGDLPGGRTEAAATNISANGNTVVGWSNSAAANGDQEAFRWTAESGMIGLGSLTNIYPWSNAEAVSGDGSVIVGSSSSDSFRGIDKTAFVWDSAHGMRDLQQVLTDVHRLDDELEGWLLKEANDISADGLSIVGSGLNPDGFNEAWLVRLDRPIYAPEPSSIAITALALAQLVHSRHATSAA